MTDPNVAVLLGGNMRVIRGKVTLEHLTAVFPTLSEQAASNSSSLTDADRRLLLDLPDEDEETANIASLSTRTKAELIAQALKDLSSLSKDELKLLQKHFWSDITDSEASQRTKGTSILLKRGREEVLKPAHAALQAAKEPAYLPNEKEAIDAASREYVLRLNAKITENVRCSYGWPDSLKGIKPWVKKVQEIMDTDEVNLVWGYVCYLDSYVQSLSESQFEAICSRMDAVLGYAESSNGTLAGPAAGRWRLQMTRDGPSTPPVQEDGSVDLDAIETYREHFATLLAGKSRNKWNVPANEQGTGLIPGILRNTLLIFDRVTVESITARGNVPDDMRILAVEYSFTPSETDKDYNGTTLVRVPQLVNNFYEQRWLHGEEEGNFQKICKAAKRSKHEAFVSLNEEKWKKFSHNVGEVSACSRET